jgi:hypothetical protein
MDDIRIEGKIGRCNSEQSMLASEILEVPTPFLGGSGCFDAAILNFG